MKNRLQSMYNHMVGWAASVISPFYFILLETNLYILVKGRIQGLVQGGGWNFNLFPGGSGGFSIKTVDFTDPRGAEPQ